MNDLIISLAIAAIIILAGILYLAYILFSQNAIKQPGKENK